MAKKRGKKKSARPALPAPGDSLPPAELDVVSCVWRENPITARRIREMLLKYRPMAHGSVVTLLTRLEAKGLIRREKGPQGKAFLFLPLKKPEAVQRKLVRDMVQQVFGGDTGAMASLLLEVNPPTVAEVATIKASLDRARKHAKKSRRQ